jgi:hypothetical protein
METAERCPECGAAWRDDLTCQDHFHQILSWESEYPDQTRAVHHLLVLCYYLQHPHLYSPQGLEGAKQLLVAFVEEQATPDEVRRRQRGAAGSGIRAWKITGTPAAHGAYARPIQWPITVVEVTAGDLVGGNARGLAWARAAVVALEASEEVRDGVVS